MTAFFVLERHEASIAKWRRLLDEHRQARGPARIRAACVYMAAWRSDKTERAAKWDAILRRVG
jgi:hypothetical protein